MSGQTKKCGVCGATFTRNASYGKSQWTRTKYCGRACAGAANARRLADARPSKREKFNSLFRVGQSCWEWVGTIDGYGYGVMDYSGQRYRAHVLAVEFDGRKIPIGHVVRHKCDNPCCVRPDHLETGTPLENVHDAISRGRFPRGERSGQAKLDAQKVREIRGSDESNAALAHRFGVSRTAIYKIKKRENWGHVG